MMSSDQEYRALTLPNNESRLQLEKRLRLLEEMSIYYERNPSYYHELGNVQYYLDLKDKALKSWITATHYGSMDAAFHAAIFFTELREYEKAFEYYEISADKGKVEAMYKLAHIYASGRGVIKDTNLELIYLTKAANERYIPALAYLVYKKFRGFSVGLRVFQIKRILSYIREQANKGNKIAMRELGMFLYY